MDAVAAGARATIAVVPVPSERVEDDSGAGGGVRGGAGAGVAGESLPRW